MSKCEESGLKITPTTLCYALSKIADVIKKDGKSGSYSINIGIPNCDYKGTYKKEMI